MNDWKAKIDIHLDGKKDVKGIASVKTKFDVNTGKCHIFFCFNPVQAIYSHGESHMEGYPPNDHEVVDRPNEFLGYQKCGRCHKNTCSGHLYRGICMYCAKKLN
jgi:hypothetical protein